MHLKMDREIQTRAAQDLASTTSDQRERNKWLTARSIANEGQDDLSIFKSILECFSYTFTCEIYQKSAKKCR